MLTDGHCTVHRVVILKKFLALLCMALALASCSVRAEEVPEQSSTPSSVTPTTEMTTTTTTSPAFDFVEAIGIFGLNGFDWESPTDGFEFLFFFEVLDGEQRIAVNHVSDCEGYVRPYSIEADATGFTVIKPSPGLAAFEPTSPPEQNCNDSFTESWFATGARFEAALDGEALTLTAPNNARIPEMRFTRTFEGTTNRALHPDERNDGNPLATVRLANGTSHQLDEWNDYLTDGRLYIGEHCVTYRSDKSGTEWTVLFWDEHATYNPTDNTITHAGPPWAGPEWADATFSSFDAGILAVRSASDLEKTMEGIDFVRPPHPSCSPFYALTDGQLRRPEPQTR